MQYWYEWVQFSGSPFVLFVTLLVLSHFLYRRYFLPTAPLIANGGIVMAISAFVLVCLPELKLPLFATIIIALELLIIWLYLASELVQTYFQDDLVLNQYTEWMSLGTWVTGTAFMDLILNEVEHTLHGVIVLLGLVSLLLYCVYIGMIVHWLVRYVRKACHLYADGMMLLAAVSTEAIVLLLYNFFHDHLPIWFYQSLIGLGFLCYLIGNGAILRYYLEARRQHLARCCHNAYSLIYGALGISGWAMIQTQSFSNSIVNVLWWLNIAAFALILLWDIWRLVRLMKSKGWRKSVWTYHSSQWLHGFAFVMLYAFAHAHGIAFITNVGQYLITVLLIFQMALALSHGSMHIIRETLCRK